MNKFTVFFENLSSEYFSLDFECYTTPIAVKWFDSLKEQEQINSAIAEKDRLYNFPTSESENTLVTNLNICINLINSSKTIIPLKAEKNMTQDHLNLLHLYFEKLRGGILSESDYWKNASNDQRKVLERYNVLIHKTENFYRNKNSKTLNPRIVCTFNTKKRKLLENEDYQHFTLTRAFGEVYINYCEVGKPLYDVFKDNDELVGLDNIRPLKYYSPDFTISFHKRSQNSVDIFLEKMNKWWDSNLEKLGDLGFYKDNPKNAIGNIPVGILKSSLSESVIIEKISEFSSLSHIKTN
jgi:hypothetical protein